MRLRSILPAIALAAIIPALVIPWILGPTDRDPAARRFSVSSMAFAVHAEVAAHERAVQVAARRLAAYQALPPELLERALAEVAAGYPAFERLMVLDASGRVLAAWQDGAAAPRAGEDPSPERRAAVQGGRSFVGVSGAAGGGDRIELAAPVAVKDRAPVAFVAADLATAGLARVLAEAESRHGVKLALLAGDRVVHGAAAPGRSWQGDAGYGMTLHVEFPAASAAPLFVAPVVSAAAAFLLAAFAAGALRRRPTPVVIS